MLAARLQPLAKRLGVGSLALLSADQVGQRFFFDVIDEAENTDAHSVIRSEDEAMGQLGTLLAAERQWTLAGERGGEAGLCTAVREAVGHSLRCSGSKVVGGGDGVFAAGMIPAGSVVSVYSGMHRSAWDGVFSRIFRMLLPWGQEDGYMLRQADGSIMDGGMQRASDQREARGYVTPSACCQLANHPPAGALPNATFLSMNIPLSGTFSALQIFRWPLRSTGQVTTLLVCTAPIADGEEVFVDYKFEGAEMPEWYTPCSGLGSAPIDGWQVGIVHRDSSRTGWTLIPGAFRPSQ